MIVPLVPPAMCAVLIELPLVLPPELSELLPTTNTHIVIILINYCTVKPETLTSGNFDKFGELGSNRQTLTFQSEASKQSKRTIQNKNKCFYYHFVKVSFVKIF